MRWFCIHSSIKSSWIAAGEGGLGGVSRSARLFLGGRGGLACSEGLTGIFEGWAIFCLLFSLKQRILFSLKQLYTRLRTWDQLFTPWSPHCRGELIEQLPMLQEWTLATGIFESNWYGQKTGGYLVFIQRGKGNILEWKVVSELRMVFFRHLWFVATASKSDWICYMQVGFGCWYIRKCFKDCDLWLPQKPQWEWKKLIMVIFGFSRLLWFESVVLSLVFVIWRIFQNNEQVSELAEVSLQSLISFGKTIDN